MPPLSMGMREYRKVWVDHFGEIPKDSEGRSFEIHHVNGNRKDNRIENLQCISAREHMEIHTRQEDWAAAAAIARRLKITPELQFELNSRAGKEAYAKRRGWFKKSIEEQREVAAKGGRAMKGRKWYNNGVVNRRSLSHPGIGWINGRLFRKDE